MFGSYLHEFWSVGGALGLHLGQEVVGARAPTALCWASTAMGGFALGRGDRVLRWFFWPRHRQFFGVFLCALDGL